MMRTRAYARYKHWPEINAEDGGVLSIYWRGGGRGTAIEDQGKVVFYYFNLLLIHCYQFSSTVYQGVTPSLTFLFWLMHVLNPFLLFFASLARFNSSFALLFPGHLEVLSSTVCIFTSFPLVSRATLPADVRVVEAPRGTRACECNGSYSWSNKALSIGSPWSGNLQ